MIAPDPLIHQLSLREELRNALTIFRRENIRNFLLRSDNRQDAAVVTAQLPQRRSVALRINSISTSVAATTFDDDFNFNVISNWLFLPAYEDGNYGMGIHLAKEDSQSTVNLLRPGFANTKYLRYVRDHVNGFHVSVGHYEEGTELTYLRGLGQTLRHRSGKVFRFNTHGFLKVMNSAVGNSQYFDVDKLMEQVNLVYSFEEDRYCPLCSAPPNVACHCQHSATTQAMIPSNACPLKRSVHNNRGEYNGTGFIELLAGGLTYRGVLSDRITTVDLSEDNSLERQLIAWAVRDRLSALRPTLSRLTMPGRENAFVDSTAFALPEIGWNFSALRLKAEQDSSPVSNEMPACVASSSEDVVMGESSHFESLMHPSRTMAIDSQFRFAISNSLNELQNAEPLSTIEAPESLHIDTEFRSTSSDSANRLQTTMACTTSPALSVGSSGTGHLSPASAASPSASAGQKNVDEQELSSTEEVPENIVKGLQIIKNRGGSTKISREELGRLVPMKQREISKVFRRARNREAAARSNAKRKQKLQNLRRNLAEVRRKAQECREKHERLKVINEELRNALRKSTSSLTVVKQDGSQSPFGSQTQQMLYNRVAETGGTSLH